MKSSPLAHFGPVRRSRVVNSFKFKCDNYRIQKAYPSDYISLLLIGCFLLKLDEKTFY